MDRAQVRLKEPKTALTRFEKLEAGGKPWPISLARAHYWQGRAHEAAGNMAAAWQQYKLASKASVTFYGQPALAKIDATPVLHITETPLDSAVLKAGIEGRPYPCECAFSAIWGSSATRACLR